jgi:putative DNA primase/helicase
MFYQIKPQSEPDRLLICEGFSTGSSLYMNTKFPVTVAFSANNLVLVAKAIRRQYPKAEILICGDNDHATEGNPGKQAAIKAAIACGGSWNIPDFTGLSHTPEDTDFNDIYLLQRASS